MSAQVRQRFIFDVATRDLWRVAESGDVNELDQVLSRGVDIDAGNEHGMTALMRAACHGHASMVSALLEQGADPNVARHDRFTALALAAFFGHTETVRLLIDHGAKTEVVTRSGTSPRMWAIARTCDEAARCLEQTAAAERPVMPAPVTTKPVIGRPVVVMPIVEKPPPVAKPFVETPITQTVISEKPAVEKPIVVKTLSEPPEIWDLVHPVPQKNFNATSAFVSRFGSTRALTIAACAVLLLIVAGGVGMFFLRSSAARAVSVEASPVQIAPVAATKSSTNEVVPGQTTPEAAQTTPEAVPVEPLVAPVVTKRSVTRQYRNRSTAADDSFAVVNEATQSAPPASASPVVEKPKTPETSTKPAATSAAVSPQLITPAKTAAPKGKVIQWP